MDGQYRKEDFEKLIEHSEKVQPMRKWGSGTRGHKEWNKRNMYKITAQSFPKLKQDIQTLIQ